MSTDEQETERLRLRVLRLEEVCAKAWELYQRAGVMREPDGRTGNRELDELGNLLDCFASASSHEEAEDLRALRKRMRELQAQLIELTVQTSVLEARQLAAYQHGRDAERADVVAYQILVPSLAHSATLSDFKFALVEGKHIGAAKESGDHA